MSICVWDRTSVITHTRPFRDGIRCNQLVIMEICVVSLTCISASSYKGKRSTCLPEVCERVTSGNPIPSFGHWRWRFGPIPVIESPPAEHISPWQSISRRAKVQSRPDSANYKLLSPGPQHLARPKACRLSLSESLAAEAGSLRVGYYPCSSARATFSAKIMPNSWLASQIPDSHGCTIQR